MRSSTASSSSSLQFVSSNDRIFWGCFFVTIGSVFFVGFLFTAVISKILPPSNNALISAIQNDWYYCFLVPLTLPVLLVAVYFHWLSMKMFKHAWFFLEPIRSGASLLTYTTLEEQVTKKCVYLLPLQDVLETFRFYNLPKIFIHLAFAPTFCQTHALLVHFLICTSPINCWHGQFYCPVPPILP